MVIKLEYLEKDIEDLLEIDCEHYLGLKFIARQLRTPVGIIDVIARCPNRNRKLYYVIEIKNGPINSAAYVQAVRYANWLNSELSKDGKRLFVPLLIGSTLSEEISTICEYFSHDHNWYEIYRKVFYRVFNFSAKEGVTFTWINNVSSKYHATLKNDFNHINQLWERVDDLEAANYRLHKAIEEFAPAEKQEENTIRLVKNNGDAA